MKKLIPALCMLLIAAALLGTSTYAWFSMNSTVTASGMTVTAKTESVFLQIIKSGDAFDSSKAQVSAIIEYANSEGWGALKPTAPAATFTPAESGGTTGSKTALTSGTTFAAMEFVEAFSAAPGESAIRGGEDGVYTKVTDAAKAGGTYTLLNKFYVRLNPTAGPQDAENLKVSAVNIESVDGADDDTNTNDVMKPAVRVLVVSDGGWTIWKYDTAAGKCVSAISSGSDIIANKVSPTTENHKEVSVYIYFDGEDGTTTTNNAGTLALDGYKVGIELSVGAAITTP